MSTRHPPPPRADCAWLLLVALALGAAACDDAPSPPLRAVDAPDTPAAQLAALRAAVDEAAGHGDWARAEVALDALLALDPDADRNGALSARRAEVHLRREVDAHADRAEQLIDAGELLEAHQLLRQLADAPLTEAERARLTRALERLRLVNDSPLQP